MMVCCSYAPRFMQLVQREWLDGGHPFSIRHNHATSAPEKDKAPIFLLFLDAVWQVCVYQCIAQNTLTNVSHAWLYRLHSSFLYRLNSMNAFFILSLSIPTPLSMVSNLHPPLLIDRYFHFPLCSGNFLYDTPKERTRNKLSEKSTSLWLVNTLPVN